MQSLFISGAEIFFIVFIVILVFGSDKLPEIVRGLGKGMRQLRDATDDIKREIQKSAEKSGIDSSIASDLKRAPMRLKIGRRSYRYHQTTVVLYLATLNPSLTGSMTCSNRGSSVSN